MSRRSIDNDMMGSEPIISKSIIVSDIDMILALNWYNYFHDVNDAKKWVVEFMKKSTYSKSDIEYYDKSHIDQTSMFMGSIAKMALSISIPEKYIISLREKISKAIDNYKNRIIKKVYIKHRQNEFIEEVEAILDTFYNKNYLYFDPKIYEIQLKKTSDVEYAIKYYTLLKQELDSITIDDEGYNRLSKKKIDNYKKFISEIINQCSIIIGNAPKKVRKVRKKKAKSAFTLVKKLKYLDKDNILGISSIPSANIIGSNILYVYNTKYKKISVYYAEDGKELSIKGSTILNFDSIKSKCKTCRKPKEFLTKLMNSGKVGLRKILDDLRSREKVVSGRINKDTLLLRAIK